ncbi:MAG: hypothetical protein PHQ12_00735 [Chthoniobacteraceae bacterium]|nr:hypothetical protein [Chthoniobacteraceae bacterium]
MACCVSAQAITYSWVDGTTGNWSDTASWTTSDSSGTAPSGNDNTAALSFGTPGMTADYTATNDISVGGAANTDFQINSLTLTGSNGTASTTRNIVIANGSNGGTLTFAGTGANVNLLANNVTGAKNIAYDVRSAVKLAADTTFTGDGSGSFLFSGGVNAGGYTLTKTGKSVLTLGGANNTLGNVLLGAGSGNKLVLAGTVSNTLGSVTLDCSTASSGILAAGTGAAVSIGAGSGDFIRVGSYNGGATKDNLAHNGVLDMSAASSFTANVGIIALGNIYSSTSAAAASAGVIKLSNGTNDITAATSIILGQDAGGAAITKIPVGQIIGGSGATTIHTPILTVGTTSGVGLFTLDAGGSVTLDGLSGGRAALNVGYSTANANVVSTGTMTLDGTFKATLNSLNIGSKSGSSNPGRDLIGVMTIGNSAANHLDILASSTNGALVIGSMTSNAGLTNNANISGNLTIGNLDATSVIENTNASGVGILIGNYQAGANASGAIGVSSSGTMTMNGGTLLVKSAGTSAAIQLGRINRTGTKDVVSATLNLLGGSLTVNNDITAAAQNGAVISSTLNIDGGTLDMGSHAIGSAAANVTNLVLASGTLKNVSEINGGADIVKTTTGTFVLAGNNTYTGATSINAGIWRVNGTATSSRLTAVNDTGTLGGTGTVGAVQVNNGGTIDPGNAHGNIGTLAVGATAIKGGASYLLEVDNGGGLDGAGSHWDQLAVTGSLDVSDLSAISQFTFKLSSLDIGGGLAGWDASTDHLWTSVLTTTDGFVGSLTADMFTVDTTGFLTNNFTGTFSIVRDSANTNSLDLLYTAAVPEPQTWGFLMLGMGAFVWRARAMRRIA